MRTHDDHSPTAGPTLAYELDRVTKVYPGQAHPANREISLQIYAGEMFGILGDNGAGKSTLVKQMVNLVRGTAGRILLWGRPLAAAPGQVPLQVGYMPQDPRTLNNLTVGEALYYTAHLRGLDRPAARAERDRLLDLWDLAPLRNRVNTRLSGGQRRLLHLAVAMAASPPILILDEPTNDLDPLRRRRVWAILRDLNARCNTTIIFITHDALEAEKVIDRVAILTDGRVAAVGRPAELKQAIDRHLRLELYYAPEAPPPLPPGLTPVADEPGHCLLLVERERLPALMAALPLAALDDVRLHSATLEDLYVHYYTRPSERPAAAGPVP